MKFDFTSVDISDALKADIEHELRVRKKRSLGFSFSQPLESLYCHYVLSRYHRANLTYVFVGALGVLFFLSADYQLLPDAFSELLQVRVLCFVVVCLIMMGLSRIRTFQEKTYHLIQSFICLGAAWVHVVLMYIGNIAAQHGELHYQNGSILLIILIAAVLRLDFRYTAGCILVIYVTQLYYAGYMLNASYGLIIEQLYIFTTVVVFSGLASARMEHEVRTTFLQSLLIEAEKRALEAARDQLHQLSLTDPLTGLANRRGLEEKIKLVWSQASRQQHPVSVLLVDIDLFKQYNDTLGHPAGDQAIIQVTRCFSAYAKRPSDIIARLGGEEFVLILPQISLPQAKVLGEKIRQAVADRAIPHPSSQHQGVLTISLGLATEIPGPHSHYEALIQRADEQLYRAKSAGRNRLEHDLLAHPSNNA